MIIIITDKLISHAKKAKLGCSLLMSVTYGQITEPLSLIVERSQVFDLRAAENDRSSAALFGAFSRRSLQTGHNVCSVLIASTQSGIFIFLIEN